MYAQLPVAFDAGLPDEIEVVNVVQPKLGKQIVLGHQLATEVTMINLPILYQHAGSSGDERAQPRNIDGQEVEEPGPEEDGQGEADAFGETVIVAGHPVLNRIGDKDDKQDIGRADLAGLTAREAKQREQDEIDDRAAHNDVE